MASLGQKSAMMSTPLSDDDDFLLLDLADNSDKRLVHLQPPSMFRQFSCNSNSSDDGFTDSFGRRGSMAGDDIDVRMLE